MKPSGTGLALACALLASAGLSAVTIAAAAGPALLPGKPGGVLNVLTREDLTQGFSIHESVTLSTIWPAQPCFNNLVAFDPLKPFETFDTVVPEPAEKSSWQDGVEATLRSIDTVEWFAIASRKDFQIGANISGYGIDDPDSNFFEHYTCRSARNYTGYCDEETEKLIEAQSQELDVKKRLALVHRIQKRLEDDAERPMLAWRFDDYAHWPHVNNLIPRHSICSYGRRQEVWLDR